MIRAPSARTRAKAPPISPADGPIACSDCFLMARMWPEFADGQARVGRPGGFAPRPAAWRAAVTRWLKGEWELKTLSGRGIGPAFRILVEADLWTHLIPHRQSVSVTVLEVR